MYFQIKVNESGRCHNLVPEKFLLMKKLKVRESPVKKKKKRKEKTKINETLAGLNVLELQSNLHF